MIGDLILLYKGKHTNRNLDGSNRSIDQL